MDNPFSKWGDKTRPFVKKLFAGYLLLVTGCSTNMQQFESVPSAESSSSYASRASPQPPPPGTDESDSASLRGKNDLPELGGPLPKEELKSNKDLAKEIEGSFPPSEQQLVADPFKSGYSGGQELQSLAVGALDSAVNSSVKDWFTARHITAEMNFGLGQDGGRSGSFDLLVPLYDGKKDLIFTQVGLRRSNAHTEDYRSTVNLGAGYRKTVDNWLLGANVFYDRDLTGKNDRLGIGAEAWTHFFKFSANGYFRISDWKKSPDLDDYLERAANGFDLRVEANLPAYPQLGGKLVYEKYYGDQVGLFGSGNRQQDPQAVTVGLTYNPVPMIGIGVDYRQGQGGLSETSGKISVNYQFGVPLEQQLSLAYTRNHRLENSRYDLVSRNNEVVLDYREKDAGEITLPLEISGTPAEVISFPITVTDRTIGNFTWTGTGSRFGLPYGGGPTGSVVLPAYNEGSTNTYTLSAVGSDRFGRVVQSNLMQVRVNAFLIALERSKAAVMANGSDEVVFTAKLQEPNGDPKAFTPVTWDVRGNATIQEQDDTTDRQGQARLSLTSRFASAVRVSVQEPQGAKAESDANFAGDHRTAKVIEFLATPSTITADGLATSLLTAKVADSNGNPVGPGAPVEWETDRGTLASASTETDQNSVATVRLTSGTQAGTANLTAKAVAGSATTSVGFVANNATARIVGIVATPADLPANGSSTSTLVATVEDLNGNPVGPNVSVAWSATSGALSNTQSITDANSKAQITLTSAKVAGTSTVTASAAAGSAETAVSFSADSLTATVASLEATPAVIRANGTELSELVASIEDASGNPVAGAPVSWATDLGVLSSTTSTTDALGKAHVSLKGAAAGSASVKATAKAGNLSTVVQLVPDNATAKVVSLKATPSNVKANGADSSELVAMIEDANGNPVAGAAVNWSTDLGLLSNTANATDGQGKASVSLKGTAAGKATVKAAAAAGAQTVGIELEPDNATANVVGLSATPMTIKANGSELSELVAIIEDASGNPVIGTEVRWTTDLGVLSSEVSMTDALGKARVSLKGSAAGKASVKASATAGAQTATVQLIPDSSTAKVVTVVATPAIIKADRTQLSELVAEIKDATGNPVAGAVVTWTTNLGDLSSGTNTTDANGFAHVTLKGAVAGQATVKASATAGASTAAVDLVPNDSTAKVVALSATPSAVFANGVDVSELVAVVEDANGNPVVGAPVAWTTNLGELTSNSSNTDAQGRARTTLKGIAVGKASVKAEAVAGSRTTSVDLLPDSATAKVMAVTATPTIIKADRTDSSELVAEVKDANGNLAVGVTVTWTSSLGDLSSGTSSTDAQGRAYVTLRGAAAGKATIKATASAGAQTATVDLIPNSSTAKVASLTATPASIKANGTDFSDLVVLVEDARGNPVAGAPVAWTASLGELSSDSSTTDAQGRARVTLKGTAAGDANVKAEAVAGSLTTTVRLTPDSTTAKVVGLTATPSSIKANGSDASVLVAMIEDASGNPVAGAPVTWTTSLGDLSSGTSTTDSQGRASVTLKGEAAGNATVKATAKAGAQTVTVQLTPDNVTAKVVSLSATPATIKADGSDLSELVAVVRDASGNAVVGEVVTWTTSLGSLSNTSSTTDAQGRARVSLKGALAGNATVQAAAVAGAQSTTVQLLPDTSTAKVVSLTVTPATITANGSDQSELEARIEDVSGNPVAGVSVTWTTSLGDLSSGKSTTDALGIARASLKGTAAGKATVKAAASAGSQTSVVDLVADGSTAKVISLSASPDRLKANGTDTSTLVARIRDANGNPVANAQVNWTSTLGDLAATSSSTDASGEARMTFKSLLAGNASIKAAAAAGFQTATIDVTADSATATVVNLSSAPGTILANGVQKSTISATVLDSNGNAPGAGVTVTFATSLGNLSALTATTNAAGIASVTLSGTAAGSAAVTAKAATATTLTTNVELMADASTAKVVSVTAGSPTIVANGAATGLFTAVVRDAYGNHLGAGMIVNWTTDRGTLSTATGTTNAAGEVVTSLSGTVAGVATVTASATAGSASASSTLIGNTATATASNLTVTPASIKANGVATSSLQSTVVDAYGNALGAGITVTFSTNLGNLSSTTATTNASGVATVTLSGTVMGTATVTAKATTATTRTATVTLVADTATAKVVSVTAGSPTIVANGSATSQFTAVVRDAYGNNVGAGVAVNWATDRGNLSAASGVTNAAGEVVTSLSGTVAGVATVTASATAGSASASITLIGNTATATASNLTVTPASIKANGVATSSLQATVVDAYGNALGAGITVTFSTNLGSLSSTTATTNASGVATVTLSGTVMGTATVTAKATTATTRTATVTLVADTSTAKVVSVTAASPSIVANGVAVDQLTAVVRDAYGNNVGAGVTVNWTTDRGTLSAATGTTNAAGEVVTFLSSTSIGVATVTATAAAGSASVSVTLIPNAATATVSNFSVTPASIKANGVDTSSLQATVVDGYGNALGAGITVTFGTNLGSLSSITATTNASGVATVTLRGTVAGTATVTARAANATTLTASVTLTADTATARVVSVTSSSPTVVANMSDVAWFTATVRDANGNNVGAGVAVTWATTNGILTASSGVTDAAGQIAVGLKGTAAGLATVTGTAAGGSASASTTLIADVATARVTTLSATPGTIVANGTDTANVTVFVTDAYGNRVANTAVAFTSSLGGLSNLSATTDSNGYAAVTIKGTVAGVSNITAKAPNTAAATTSLTLVGDATTAQVVSVVATPAAIKTGETSTVVATVRDANGNNVGSGVNTWISVAGIGGVPGSLQTDANGQVTFTLSSETPVEALITVMNPDMTQNMTATLSITSKAPVVSSFTFLADANQWMGTAGVSSRADMEMNCYGWGAPTWPNDVFSWSVSNAVSYTLSYASNGKKVVYSGNASSWTVPQGSGSSANKYANLGGLCSGLPTNGNGGTRSTWTLEAFGADGSVTTKNITVDIYYIYQEPSG